MDIQYLRTKIVHCIPIGTIFNNPGGGTTTIHKYSDNKLFYIRGKSKISMSFEDIFNTYTTFKGTQVTTNDLKKYNNHFDSKARKPSGHNCNCTSLFMILHRIGLAEEIKKFGRSFGTVFY